MDSHAATALVMDALANAIAGNADGAATVLETLGQQDDDGHLMYGVCCALASAGHFALKKIYGDRAPRPGSGGMWAMEQLRPGALDDDPADTFSLRFLIAYANGDTDTCLALYETACRASDEQYVKSVIALLKNVAGITSLALDQQKDDRR